MHDLSLRQTARSKTRPRPAGYAWASGLAGGQRWIGAALFLFCGTTVHASPPPETEVAAARTQLAQRLPKQLGVELVPDCFRSGKDERACTLAGDFDGDDKSDLAVLVQDQGCQGVKSRGACKRVGIAFLLGNGKCEVLGAGHGHWRHVDENTGRVGAASALAASDFAVESADRWSWRVWRLTAEGLRPLTGHGPYPAGRPPGLRHDAVELSGGDAAILLYRSAQGWIQYNLGY